MSHVKRSYHNGKEKKNWNHMTPDISTNVLHMAICPCKVIKVF